MAVKKIMIILGLFLSMVLYSQKSVALNGNFSDGIIHSYTGIYLVRTKSDLLAIDPEKQDVIWKHENLNKLDFDRYHEVPLTSIVIFDIKPLVGSNVLSKTIGTKGTSKLILDTVGGKILFDSRDHGFKSVERSMLLPEKKAILLSGVKDKKNLIALFDYGNQQFLWQNEDQSSFLKNVKGSLFNNEAVSLDAQKNIFWLKNRQLIQLSGTTGELLYEAKDISSYALEPSGKKIFLFSKNFNSKQLDQETEVKAFDTQKMDRVWSDTPKVFGNVVESIIDNDKVVVITSKGFNIISIENGQKKWQKGAPLPLIRKIVPLNDGYLVVQDKFLTKVDSKGQIAWSDKIKITHTNTEGPLHLIDEEGKALYVTPSKANLVDLKNGKKQWEEDIVLNSASFVQRNLKLKVQYYQLWHDKELNKFPVYSNDTLYLFDPKTGKKPTGIGGFEIERSSPELMVRKNGYFVFGQNKFTLLRPNGELVYQKEYPFDAKKGFFSETLYLAKRGLGTTRAALGFVGSQVAGTVNTVLVSTDLGVFSTVSSSIYGSYRSYQASIEKLTDLNRIDINSNLERILKRVNKGRTDDDEILLISTENETSKVIKLNIDSGAEKVVMEVDFEYDGFLIDPVEHLIYFQVGDAIEIHHFPKK